MELTINHQTHFYEYLPNTLADLMQLEFPESKKGIAVAINNKIIPKPSWEITNLSEKDSILIITATQGG